MERARKAKKKKVEELPERLQPKQAMDEGARKAAGKLTAGIYAGLGIGVVWCAVFMAMNYFNLPLIVSAIIVAAVPYLLTGFRNFDDFTLIAKVLLMPGSFKDKQEILEMEEIETRDKVALFIPFVLSIGGAYILLKASGAFPSYLGVALVLPPVVGRYLATSEMYKQPHIASSKYCGLFQSKKGLLKYIMAGILAIAIGVLAMYLCLDIIGEGAYMLAMLSLCANMLTVSILQIMIRNQLCGVSDKFVGFSVMIGEAVSIAAAAFILVFF